MTKIVMTNSFRGGTGKSTITSNLSSLIAKSGKKVVIIDTDICSPGIHNIFGLNESHFKETFSDFMFRNKSIDHAIYDISETINSEENTLLMIPASTSLGDIAQTVQKDTHKALKKVVNHLVQEHQPDYIFIDTHPGINEEVLLIGAIADIVLTIVRPDNQDYEGARISSQVIKKIGGKTSFLLNKVHRKLNGAQLKKDLEKRYKVPVVGALPFDEDILFAESKYIFSIKHPDHKFSQVLSRVVEKVFNIKPKERLEVTYDLLKIINSNKNKIFRDKLKKLSKLDVGNFRDYTQVLSEKGFITSNGKTYSLTKSGKEYLGEYKIILGFIDSFGL